MAVVGASVAAKEATIKQSADADGRARVLDDVVAVVGNFGHCSINIRSLIRLHLFSPIAPLLIRFDLFGCNPDVARAKRIDNSIL